jgi:hypothetical protein
LICEGQQLDFVKRRVGSKHKRKERKKVGRYKKKEKKKKKRKKEKAWWKPYSGHTLRPNDHRD